MVKKYYRYISNKKEVIKNPNYKYKKIEHPSFFLKSIINPPKELIDLDKMMSNKCIDDKYSLIHQMTKKHKNGIYYYVFKKNSYLYKSFRGFITVKQTTNYS